jgi:hypothetical protein
MTGHASGEPVEKTGSSPLGANRSFGLPVRVHGIIPDVHTLYDYDKGIS